MDKEFLRFIRECVGDSPHQCDDETMAWYHENYEVMEEKLSRDERAREIIQEWVDKQGHNRCWYYPELFRQLAVLYGVKPTVDPALPPEEEFKQGCEQYRGEEYGKPA